jgi:6-phosphogluconolactonase
MSNPPNPTPTSSCTPSSTPEFAYSLNIDTTQPYFPPFGYAVSIYSVNSCTGALSATTPTSVATGFAPPQQGAEGMVVDPLGRFAYVANLVSNATNQSTISMFTIDAATGILKPTMPATVPTGFFPQGIAIDPLGRFVYTANSDDDTVSMFTINQTTGVLTPTTPAAVSTYVPSTNAQNSDPVNVTADPSGKFLYVVNGEEDTISMFDINQTTGVLTPTTPATVRAGLFPFAIAIAPNGKFAYVPDNSSNGVWQYTVDPNTGVLTPVASRPVVPAGNSPTAVTVDSTSQFAYATNRNDNTVSMYSIDQTSGALSWLGVVPVGTQPFRILFDPSGKFLYVVNEGGPTSVFTLKSDGTLVSAGSGATGNSSLSIAFGPGK